MIFFATTKSVKQEGPCEKVNFEENQVPQMCFFGIGGKLLIFKNVKVGPRCRKVEVKRPKKRCTNLPRQVIILFSIGFWAQFRISLLNQHLFKRHDPSGLRCHPDKWFPWKSSAEKGFPVSGSRTGIFSCFLAGECLSGKNHFCFFLKLLYCTFFFRQIVVSFKSVNATRTKKFTRNFKYWLVWPFKDSN